jgi:hypothetical protein
MGDSDLYRERAHLVALLATHYPSVLSYNDPREPDWPVIYVDTPEGHLSWHIAPSDLDLFGHVPVVPPGHVAWYDWPADQNYGRVRKLLARARSLTMDVAVTQAGWCFNRSRQQREHHDYRGQVTCWVSASAEKADDGVSWPMLNAISSHLSAQLAELSEPE